LSRHDLLAGAALAAAVGSALWGTAARGQDLQSRPVAPPPPAAASGAPVPNDDQVSFTAAQLEYQDDADVVTATGDVRMFRAGERLRADKVVWNRRTGRVTATGDVAVTNPRGDVAYGDSIELGDTLKDGVVQDLLLVLEQGGRLASQRGTRQDNGTVLLDRAAYTPCAVTDSEGCPKEPSWKVTAVRVVYRPDRSRVYFNGARLHLFGLPVVPLPNFSAPVGGESDSGVLTPDAQYSRANGLELSVPYFFRLAPNRSLTVTPYVFSSELPMLQLDYSQLTRAGAFRVGGYGTVSRRSDDLNTPDVGTTERAFRGYLDGVGRFQLSPEWSVSGSLRMATDRTFLRRYGISRDDRLRSTASLERIDPNSYFALTGWAVQTLRVNDRQGLQPIALPELDYRRLIDGPLGGRMQLQVNTLALTRTDGQDTQRAFAAVRWDLRRITDWGQELTLTAYARADAYNTRDTLSTAVAAYRGDEGFTGRGIAALAADLRWPFVGNLGATGTQRVTPRFQVVAAPHFRNLAIPNEDSRSIDLDSSNLFSLNRFSGYDRVEDTTRATYGAEYAATLPGIAIDAVVGQSYRLDSRPTLFIDGTGLTDRFSDIVGRTEVRFRDFVSVTHRYRLDKDSFAVRRNEVDATIGSRATYALVGYLRLNRNIFPAIEDLLDREELRAAGRVQFARFWSVFGSTVIDLTDRSEDPFNTSDGFTPIRHRLGVTYEDDCLRLGFTWRRDYRDTGDARRGNNFALTLALTNLGR